MAWLETVTSTDLIDDAIRVTEYSLAHAGALGAALSRRDNLDLIKQAAQGDIAIDMTGRRSVTVIDAPWFTSSCTNAAATCVEVRFAGDAVLVRDSKDRAHGPTLAVTTTEWAVFLDGLAGRH